MTLSTIPSPQTPWAASIKQRMSTAGLIALGALLAGLVVKTTGLSGKLGFSAAFFVIATLLIFIQQLRLRDLAAAKDSLLSSLA
jgi:predicted MFS family arabinose efflux permease